MNGDEDPKPTLDDALMDPELIRFPSIRAEEYPHHAVLRPQWLKSHSRYPFWVHDITSWLWMTKPTQYAGEIESPEMGLIEYVDFSDRPQYTGQDPIEEEEFKEDPEKHIPINPPGEIYVVAATVPEPTPLGMFPTVKAAMAAFEELWLANRSRIWETGHTHPETIAQAPDWRTRVRDLQFPPPHPMREQIEFWIANLNIRRPVIQTRFGDFLIYKPEAVSFYQNPEYPGGEMLRLSDKNGDHMISITMEAVTKVDAEAAPRSPPDPETTFEAV